MDSRTSPRRSRATTSVPRLGAIVITTGRNLAVDREMAFEAGCDEYVEKPFNPKELAALLQRLLADKGDHAGGSPE